MQGIEHLTELEVLDASNNAVESIQACDELSKLKDMWLNDNQIEDKNALLSSLSLHRESLTCLYLSNNPAFQNINGTKAVILSVLPRLEQLDSDVL